MMRLILLTVLSVAATAGEALAQERLLDKVPQLQETARRANAGALGCGFTKVTLITSRGQIQAFTINDPVHVFGFTIRVSDLLPLLEARAEANRAGAVNQMSGDVSDLAYVILLTLSLAKDPASIPPVAALLKDKNDTIRGWSASTLYEIASSGEEAKALVRKIEFPRAAVDSAKSRGKEPPDWVKIAPGN